MAKRTATSRPFPPNRVIKAEHDAADEEEEHSYSYETYDETDYSYNTRSPSKYIGIRVYHETFGYGKIVAVSGNMCEVEFENYGRKKVMGSYLTKA